jgi:hypothetical protein
MRLAINRKRRAVLKKTPAEKARLSKKRHSEKTAYHAALDTARNVVMEHAEQLRDTFGRHSVDYYYEEIMQLSRKNKTKREKINLWNVFTRVEAQRVNKGTSNRSLIYSMMLISYSEGDGRLNCSSSQIAPDLAVKWKAMTQEEKLEATSGAVEELKAQRETKAFAVQNSRLSAFYDARTNLDAIEDEVLPHACYSTS